MSMIKVIYYIVLAASLYVLYGLGEYLFSTDPSKGQATFLVLIFFMVPAIVLAIIQFVWSHGLYEGHAMIRFWVSIATGTLLVGTSIWALVSIK